jgi:hypothetical protein
MAPNIAWTSPSSVMASPLTWYIRVGIRTAAAAAASDMPARVNPVLLIVATFAHRKIVEG